MLFSLVHYYPKLYPNFHSSSITFSGRCLRVAYSGGGCCELLIFIFLKGACFRFEGGVYLHCIFYRPATLSEFNSLTQGIDGLCGLFYVPEIIFCGYPGINDYQCLFELFWECLKGLLRKKVIPVKSMSCMSIRRLNSLFDTWLFG